MITEDSQKPSIFEGFVRNTIIFYLLLILVGYLSIISYYKLFGVNISEYFSIEDYIDIFFNNLFLLILFSLFNITTLLIANDHGQKQKARRIVLFPKVEERISYLEKKIKKGETFMKAAFIISLSSEIILSITYLFTDEKMYLLVISATLFIPIFSGIYLLANYLDKSNIFSLTVSQMAIFILILSISYFKFYLTFSNGYYLLTDKTNHQKMTIVFDSGNPIKTSDSTLYIGKSKDYIFLYTKLDKMALIYNKTTIRRIEGHGK